MNKGEIAKANFLNGLNCAQAVVCAFTEEIGVSEEILKRASVALGGGFSRQRLTCGAVLGMGVVIGFLKSDGKNKGEVYALTQKACKEFEKEVGSISCAVLLKEDGKDTSSTPSERTEEYYKKRPCAELCQIAGNLLEKLLLK